MFYWYPHVLSLFIPNKASSHLIDKKTDSEVRKLVSDIVNDKLRTKYSGV